jgi:hypothetical protein
MGSNDIVDRLEAAAETVPEDLSALLLKAADEIQHLRDRGRPEPCAGTS